MEDKKITLETVPYSVDVKNNVLMAKWTRELLIQLDHELEAHYSIQTNKGS